MSVELRLLVWSAALALAQMGIAVGAAITQVGFFQLIGNRADFPGLTGWADRARRAQLNTLEILPVFAALVLVAQVAGKTNAATAFGAELFFWARLAYAPVYVIGVPGLRTVLWAVSFAGLLQVLLQLF